ncbi:hypothetical protein NDU88_003490 [Pleurodeles waltl]|uniref:Uncharacterized protein n=1 Tax=Pleurodeles waltl TaxID=8319 RepID=A0AAV7M5G5_PLEWA|nr:hypothetical protein NDU88_003490 [Pleurodeles waltl]
MALPCLLLPRTATDGPPFARPLPVKRASGRFVGASWRWRRVPPLRLPGVEDPGRRRGRWYFAGVVMAALDSWR